MLAGRLKPVLDRRSPFPFTADGVNFQLQASKHAHGKFVVAVLDAADRSADVSGDHSADGSAADI